MVSPGTRANIWQFWQTAGWMISRLGLKIDYLSTICYTSQSSPGKIIRLPQWHIKRSATCCRWNCVGKISQDDVVCGNDFRVTGPWRGQTTGHRWIPLIKDCVALVFSLLLPRTCCWTNCWVAGDLRWHGARVIHCNDPSDHLSTSVSFRTKH